ncbi:MAG: penicillin-binding protein 2 [Elusimicrobia bacterium]|nr:penicillin-binding protein 2 [Elusimicrobiota bacterium]
MTRLWIVLAAVFVIFGAVLLRLGQLQIFLHHQFKEKSLSELIEKKGVRPFRGRILDRRGQVLAVTVERPSIFLARRESPASKTDLVRLIQSVLPAMAKSEIESKLKSPAKFIWIKRSAEVEEGAALSRLGTKGLGVVPEPKRYYPGGPLALSLLGAVGTDGDGSSGIERRLDPLLGGDEEIRLVLRDARRKIYAEREEVQRLFDFRGRGKEPGPFDVYLTIDARFQGSVEEKLNGVLQKNDARAASVVVIEVKTGAVRAMANALNSALAGAWSEQLDANLAASYTFEPGSVIKPLILASALGAGAVKETDVFDCEGGKYHIMPGLTIEDHEPYHLLRLGEVLAYSSNIGFAKIGGKTGAPRLFENLRAFGFGSRTMLPLTGEAAGILRSLDEWGPMSLPMISFGYEIGVTALQLTQAFAALANNGEFLETQLIEAVSPYRRQRKVFQFSPRRVRRAADPDVARRVLQMMEEVVRYGTGVKAQIGGWPAAGKTGTAQKIDPKTKKHTPDHVMVSFCGVFPMPKPEFSICAVVDDPRKPRVAWASDIAAPLFKAVAMDAISVFGIAPQPFPLAPPCVFAQDCPAGL